MDNSIIERGEPMKQAHIDELVRDDGTCPAQPFCRKAECSMTEYDEYMDCCHYKTMLEAYRKDAELLARPRTATKIKYDIRN